MLDRQHVVTPSYTPYFINQIQEILQQLPYESLAVRTLEQPLLRLRNPEKPIVRAD